MLKLPLYAAAFAMLAVPAFPQQSTAEKAGQKTESGAEKAGEATEGAFKKAGKATNKGLSKAGEGTGVAVEKTGEGLKKAGKATGNALENAGEAVGDFFDGKESSSDRVKEVQTALSAKGYYSGPVDGIVGPQTRSAVREFQSDEKLAVTGKVNDDTAKRLGVD